MTAKINPLIVSGQSVPECTTEHNLPVSLDDLWRLVNGGAEPVALFGPAGELIRRNSNFEKKLPSIQCLSDLPQSNSASGDSVLEIDGVMADVQLERLAASGVSVVRALQPADEKNQIESYLQARDTMFTVSRTVSVSEMAMTLAHEINTPIATINNLLHVIQKKLSRVDGVSEDVINALGTCAEQTAFTRDVIDRIRNFTQKRQPVRENIEVQTFVEEAVNLLDWHFSLNECKVRIQLPEAPVVLNGDRVMLQQVLLNLLKNAADAMGNSADERIIDISLVFKSTKVRIHIRDHGEGLGASRGSLFSPFVSNKPAGMGIGLNICRSFLELHAGRMWLSDAEGAGCVATIELPLPKDTQA